MRPARLESSAMAFEAVSYLPCSLDLISTTVTTTAKTAPPTQIQKLSFS